MFLPPEVERFVISEDSMKDLLTKKLGSEVRSLDVDGEQVKLRLPDSFLSKVAEESYGTEIDSVRMGDSEVEVTLSGSLGMEGEDNGGESFDI